MKGFYINITNNLLEPKHRKAMGTAVWEFMWCLDKITRIDDDGIGWVFGGNPIQLKDIKAEIGISESKISKNIKKLENSGYLITKRTPFGLIIGVKKAQKRFALKGKSDLPKRTRDLPFRANPNICIDINNDNTKGHSVADATRGFDFDVYLQEMRVDPRRHIQIIALYWEKKKYCFFESRDQCESSIKRDLKAALAIKSYSDSRISEVMEWLNTTADYAWTLETVNKKINEDLSQAKTVKKKTKPYYDGLEMRQRESDKKWFVIKNGEWYEFSGKEKDIIWK